MYSLYLRLLLGLKATDHYLLSFLTRRFRGSSGVQLVTTAITYRFSVWTPWYL